MTVQLFENFEYEALRQSIDYYFSKLINQGAWSKAADVMKRLRAYVDSKIAILEKAEMARNYGAVCPKCGCDEVEWVEKVHDCQDCAVWVISCLDCKCEWLDMVWKSK
ncbi:MAG: hypothetical protein QW175_05925 [Candidatus Bathyarchaeia archaeon]